MLWALTGAASAENPVPSESDLQRAAALDSLKAKYQITALGWGKSGTPDYIKGRLSEPLRGRSPEDVFYEFMEDNVRWTKIADPRSHFRVTGGLQTFPQSGRTALTFKQYYQGIPIYDSRVHVGFDENRVMDRIRGEMYPGIEITLGTRPTVSRDAALELIADSRGLASRPKVYEEELIIYHSRLAWRLVIVGQFEGEYYIDAHSGEILSHMSMKRYALPPKPVPSQPEIPLTGAPDSVPDSMLRMEPMGESRIPAESAKVIRPDSLIRITPTDEFGRPIPREQTPSLEEPKSLPPPDTAMPIPRNLPKKGDPPPYRFRSWPGKVALPLDLEWRTGSTSAEGKEPVPGGPQARASSEAGVVTILSEGFEGAFPSGWVALTPSSGPPAMLRGFLNRPQGQGHQSACH
ncbi:MAG TPA: hypothetical protein VM118_02590 [Acidobacteriota bacterium]|nr:hypothetical protein [Acidobacteriota bacterium]